MRMDEFNVRMKKRGVERVNEVLAERRTDEAIRETAWAKIRTCMKWAIILFLLGIVYFVGSVVMKMSVDIYIFLLIYCLSFLFFVASLIARHRLSRGLYGTTSNEVRDIISHVLSRQKR